MNEALRQLLADGPPDEPSIDAFLAQRELPLVDPGEITFVYRGEADEVLLRRWISGLSAALPLRRVDGTTLWTASMRLPEHSRIEYKFEVRRGGESQLVTDPLNPLQARDPFGANSVCRGYRYQRPAWTLPDDTARSGTLDRLEVHSRQFGDARHIGVYLPARFRRTRRYPLLIVHDGFDYVEYAALRTVLDNLIQHLEIPEIVVALTQSPDRLREYAGDARHAGFVAEELPAELGRRFPLIDSPRSRCLMGASFGAVASLHAAWCYPGRFDRLLLQSGSFAFSDLGGHGRGTVFDPVADFMNRFRTAPGRPAGRVYMSCGIYESLIYENRSLVPLLRDQRIDLRYEEVRDGHNWENWRDRLRTGLAWLFPGPLWLVYE